MAVTDVVVDDRIRAELGDRIHQVLGCLYAGSCQTCGQPLGQVPTTLSVSDLGSAIAADLHHATCRLSAWREIQITWADAHFRTSHTIGFVMPGESQGRPDPRAMLLVNPSLEQVVLTRDHGGRPTVQPNVGFHAAGLRAPLEVSFDRPLADVVAELRADRAVVVFESGLFGPFEFVLDQETYELAARHGSVVLAVTHAVDPHSVRGLPDLAPVMGGQATVMGLVELESVRRGRPNMPGPDLGKRLVVQWDPHEIWAGELVEHQAELLSDDAAKAWAEQRLAGRELHPWEPLGAAGPVGWSTVVKDLHSQFVLVCHSDGWRLVELYARSQGTIDEPSARTWASEEIKHRLGIPAAVWTPGPTSIEATTLYAAV
jgi:hypothetical protein